MDIMHTKTMSANGPPSPASLKKLTGHTLFHAQVTIGSGSPFPRITSSSCLSWPLFGAGSKPKSIRSGKSFFASRAFCSDHARSRTRSNSRAFVRSPWLEWMASLTRLATSFRRLGLSSAARGGASFSGGKIKRAMVRSRSSRNSGFVGARGARCVVAKFRAGVMSALSVNVHKRISSTSWRRSKEKCRDESWSRILNLSVMALLSD